MDIKEVKKPLVQLRDDPSRVLILGAGRGGTALKH